MRFTKRSVIPTFLFSYVNSFYCYIYIKSFTVPENSATLMNSKITGGLPVFEESRRNHLVSIQLHGKHFCTGIIFSKNAVISTANCALQILSYLMVRDAQGNPIVRVCFAHILDDSSRCTSIWRIAKHYLFKANSVQDLNGKPSKQENIGLILVERDLYTSVSEKIDYFKFGQVLDNKILRVTGWESKKKNLSTLSQEVYYINNHKDIKVKVMTNEDCYKHFNRSFKLAFNSKCIRKEVDAYFELQDIGSPVYDDNYSNVVIGIVSYIGSDKETAVMSLLKSVYHEYPSSFWTTMTPPMPFQRPSTSQKPKL